MGLGDLAADMTEVCLAFHELLTLMFFAAVLASLSGAAVGRLGTSWLRDTLGIPRRSKSDSDESDAPDGKS